MANPIIKIKRSTSGIAPVALQAGELAMDLINKDLYIGDASGTPLAIGGEGTFATKAYVASAVSGVSGTLGTMASQNANSVAITGGTIDSVAITGVATPTNANDAANKSYVDSSVSALGSVFHFVGNVSAATGNDLDTLIDTATGAYYKVDVAGTYTSGATSFSAKVGDAFVKTSTGWQKLDNVDAEVLGTANEIAVTGDENVGYTVAIDPVFSGRVTTAEGDIVALQGRATDLESKTQNIDLNATVPGTTKINGQVEISHGGYSTVFYDNSGGLTTSSPINVANQQGVYTDQIQPFNGNLVITGYNDPITINGPILRGRQSGSSTTLEDFILDGGSY